MIQDAIQCPGCGSSNVRYLEKEHKIVCNQCGLETPYSRLQMNSNGKIRFARQNAVKFFINGDMENSWRYAMQVLNVHKDSVPALYILAYYEEFVVRRGPRMKKFFQDAMSISLEYDEVRELIALMTASIPNMREYEKEILVLIATNMQAPEDAEELMKFCDNVSAYCISKRPSIDFLTDDMLNVYEELAQHCAIPRTCLALIKGIQSNPDSPYRNNTFAMKQHTRYFYAHYVLAVGKVVTYMCDNPYKAKFQAAFSDLKKQYEQRAGYHSS